MVRKDFYFIVWLFITWRVALFLIQYFAVRFIPLQHNFLGGGLGNYLTNPYFWSWANFDGEHYVALAGEGYRPLTYYFFPLFPILIRSLAGIWIDGLRSYVFSGLIISHLSLFIALIGFWRLVRLDYDESVSRLSLILILVFPTSFYFGAIYTESLFLALSVWSVYFARKKKWFYSSVLAGFASATRLVGVVLAPVIFLEFYRANKKVDRNWWKLIPILFLAVSGILIYVYYLWQRTGDPLNFYHTVGVFGAQRSSNLVLLPQVFYRYIFKIIPSLSFSYFPLVFVALLEFFTAGLFLVLSVWSFFKVRLSYTAFLFLGYLLPAFSGSFSSLPRYVLILFPAFILLAIYLNNIPRFFRISVYILMFTGLVVSELFFIRGYWLS